MVPLLVLVSPSRRQINAENAYHSASIIEGVLAWMGPNEVVYLTRYPRLESVRRSHNLRKLRFAPVTPRLLDGPDLQRGPENGEQPHWSDKYIRSGRPAQELCDARLATQLTRPHRLPRPARVAFSTSAIVWFGPVNKLKLLKCNPN